MDSREIIRMGIYEDFATFYISGPWPGYSMRMAEALPELLKKFDIHPQTILDLACGEGSFAVAMVRSGYQVTGVDLSPRMLGFARKQAEKEGASVAFLNHDMRSLPFNEEFDIVTCWFDSLNYLLNLDDLRSTFEGAARALKKNGFFIFDMNTVYGLMAYEGFGVSWKTNHTSIIVDAPGLFVVNRAEYDFEKCISKWNMTGFMRGEQGWLRMDEIHEERGYHLEEIRSCLGSAGFEQVACFGNIFEMSEPAHDAKRLWFVLKKG
ncbi:MAG: class I SAM-dependent methyltransferase [Chloroflexota bacterium]